jgi:hypothetical protein
MPNHYTNIVLCTPGDEFDAKAFNEQHGKSDFCQTVRPMPDELKKTASGSVRRENGQPMSPEREAELVEKHGAADWYDWVRQNWGTKWGTYEAKAHRLGGDGSPVVIEFQTAWSPPKPEVLEAILAWLREAHGFERTVAIGHDPYDCTFARLD